MRKVLALVIVGLLLSGGVAFATGRPASDSVDIFGKFRGPNGVTPTTEIVKVRYGYTAKTIDPDHAGITSGDVLVWDTNSNDAYTISICITDFDGTYAGVAVTAILSAENSVVRGDGVNVGYMAIKGYCLAKCDATGVAEGDGLLPHGNDLVGSFITSTDDVLSRDIGCLLKDTDADGVMKVWLR